jgi:LPS export ABC transporter protein LptC
MKKILFLFSSLFLLAIIAVYLNQEKFLSPGLQLGMDSYMNDASILQKREGEVKWELKAKRAVFFNNDVVNLSDLKITFPEKDLVLTSERGMYDIENRNLTIEGNIKASTDDYDILATTLFWDSSEEKIFSEERVRVVGRNFVVDGDGLTATTDKARLNNNVKAVFYGK